MLYMGVDPGQKGAVGFVNAKANDAFVEKLAGKTDREIWELIESHKDMVTFAFIEKVASFPGQGVASTFKFGKSFGFLIGCLAASGIPYDFVPPGVWQRRLGCLNKGKKAITKAACQRLFPSVKVTNDTADGLLLAEYARRKDKGI